MDRRYRRPLNRSVVLAVVLGGHLLLLLLLASSRFGQERAGKTNTEIRSILVRLDLERPEPVRPPPRAKKPAATPISPSRSPAVDSSVSAESSSAFASMEDTSGVAANDTPPIDWRAEAQRTAQGMAPGLLKQQSDECEKAKRLGKYPPGCKKPPSAYEKHFEPELKRVGVQGLIPYVRIGKRCVVALIGFGCALGKLPEADGTVFDDMRDPDRPRSSVPESNDPGFATAKMPAPLAIEPLAIEKEEQ
jgi:hypothetical protein